MKIYYLKPDQAWLMATVKPLLIGVAGILVVLASVNIFTVPIDYVAAWGALAGVVNW